MPWKIISRKKKSNFPPGCFPPALNSLRLKDEMMKIKVETILSKKPYYRYFISIINNLIC